MIENIRITINSKSWIVRCANTELERQLGLSGIPSMESQTGMLFDMGTDSRVSVTTKRMLFPLDIVYLSSDLKVVDVDYNIPRGLIAPPIYCRYFLEVNAKEARRISVGEQVKIEYPNEEEE
jgi:uncharacterized membrane protein (UPF0127 family)